MAAEGMLIATTTAANQNVLPRKRSFAKPNPAMVASSTVSAVAPSETIEELSM